MHFAPYGRVTFLCLLKDTHQKNTKGTRMLPFVFPVMLRQAHPETPAHPALLGKPERDFKIKIKIKSRIGSKIVGPNSFGQ